MLCIPLAFLVGHQDDQKLQLHQRAACSFTIAVPDSSVGFGLTTNEQMPVPADWTEPNQNKSFSIGFDLQNPKSEDPFNAFGNIYGMPEREISLHFDGREIANRLSTIEIKGKEKRFDVMLERVVGGSAVTVKVDGTAVYDRFFVPRLQIQSGEWLLAGSGITPKTLAPTFSGRDKAMQSTSIRAFDEVLNDASRHRNEATLEFPTELQKSTGRLVATLKLGTTSNGLDPWDRLAHIWLMNEQGEKFEVLRYITPYRKDWEWSLDLTDLLPLLKGKCTLIQECETYGAGWLVTLDFEFFPGELSPRPTRITPLWNGVVNLGLADQPIEKFFSEKKHKILNSSKAAKVYSVVTGHGMSPNTGNAAEFKPMWRELEVNTQKFRDTLWKTDNYLNPCRPQGGTWKYHRAGWAPGDVVRPWTIDLTSILGSNRQLTLNYRMQHYVNLSPVEGNLARHVVTSYLIEYR